MAQKRQPRVERRLAVRVRSTREPHQPSVEPTNLLGLKVLDEICQYQGPRLAVEEDNFLHKLAATED